MRKWITSDGEYVMNFISAIKCHGRCMTKCIITVITNNTEWPEHEVDHSPPSSTIIKNAWSYTSTPLVCFHGVMFDEARSMSSWHGA